MVYAFGFKLSHIHRIEEKVVGGMSVKEFNMRERVATGTMQDAQCVKRVAAELRGHGTGAAAAAAADLCTVRLSDRSLNPCTSRAERTDTRAGNFPRCVSMRSAKRSFSKPVLPLFRHKP